MGLTCSENVSRPPSVSFQTTAKLFEPVGAALPLLSRERPGGCWWALKPPLRPGRGARAGCQERLAPGSDQAHRSASTRWGHVSRLGDAFEPRVPPGHPLSVISAQSDPTDNVLDASLSQRLVGACEASSVSPSVLTHSFCSSLQDGPGPGPVFLHRV